jgi:hypothetical protein
VMGGEAAYVKLKSSKNVHGTNPHTTPHLHPHDTHLFLRAGVVSWACAMPCVCVCVCCVCCVCVSCRVVSCRVVSCAVSKTC